MRVKEESEKAGLKLNIQNTKIMASSPITSWQIEWETVETVANFIFLGSKIAADSDCRLEIKRHLLLERKAMTNLDNILKYREITLPTKVYTVKAIVGPVVRYVCESWEFQRIDGFKLWCWRRLLRVPWTARRSNQLILKEINPETPLHLPPNMKNWPAGKDPGAGKAWGQKEKDKTEDEMIGWCHWLNGHEFWANSGK